MSRPPCPTLFSMLGWRSRLSAPHVTLVACERVVNAANTPDVLAKDEYERQEALRATEKREAEREVGRSASASWRGWAQAAAAEAAERGGPPGRHRRPALSPSQYALYPMRPEAMVAPQEYY